MQQSKLRIAIQKDGRLKEESFNFLNSLGLEFVNFAEKKLIVSCNNYPLEILCVRHGDIPQYVEQGIADFAILGGNVLFESDFAIKVLAKLGFGKCSLVIAVPENSNIVDPLELDGERIATSYPSSLKKFLKEKNLKASIIPIKGSVEITCGLGLADAICDIVQTGRTLQENGLKVLETLYNSEAIFVESLMINSKKEVFLKEFLEMEYEKV